MAIRVVSIGKTNFSYVKSGLEDYLQRLKHYVRMEWEELPDIKKIDRNNASLLKEKEGELLLSKTDVRDTVVVLDEQGKQLNSVQFADMIGKHMLYETGNLVMLIGGAYGFSDAVYERANTKVSLSAMTFNHQLVRLILAEQLYRAFTIIKGEPYHHA